jgi:predicted  nucleic acid-binding Zn-ribbon protein
LARNSKFYKKNGKRMTEIKQLEYELNKKTEELVRLWSAYNQLFERFKQSTESLRHIECQLKDADEHLLYLRAYINEYITDLAEENQKLKFSADVWLKRALKLEWDVLNARNETQKIEAEHNLAITKMIMLEDDLKSAKNKINENGL